MYFFVPESSNGKDKITQTAVLPTVGSNEGNVLIKLNKKKKSTKPSLKFCLDDHTVLRFY